MTKTMAGFAAPLLLAEMRDGVKWLRLNRLSSANAINELLQRELWTELDDARRDPGAMAVVLASASARIFSAGADLKEYGDLAPDCARRRRRELLCETLLRLADFPKPIVACVTGKAIGAGCMLAFLCDEMAADARASFSFPEIRLGMVSPFAAAAARHRAGRQAMQAMVLRGEVIDGAAAAAMGLLDIFSTRDVEADAHSRAVSLGSQNANAYGRTKAWANQGVREDLRSGLAESGRLDALGLLLPPEIRPASAHEAMPPTRGA